MVWDSLKSQLANMFVSAPLRFSLNTCVCPAVRPKYFSFIPYPKAYYDAPHPKTY